MHPAPHDFLLKKCNKLMREVSVLQLESDRAKKEIRLLKKSTIRTYTGCSRFTGPVTIDLSTEADVRVCSRRAPQFCSLLAMPDSGARQWFITVTKIFSNKSSELDIFEHARKLGIADPKDLASCLQDTTSNTARQVVRLLYSATQLIQMSGTDVPSTQRQAIRGMNPSRLAHDERSMHTRFQSCRICRVSQRSNIQS